MNALVVEMLARGIAIGALAAMAAGFARGGLRQPVRFVGVVFCASVIAYALNSSPAVHAAIGAGHWLVHFLSLGGVGVFWLFIVTLFEDRPLSIAAFGPWALLTAIGFLGIAAPISTHPRIWVVHNLIETVFAAHALYVIVRSWRGDLVESRRRLRGPFLAAVTIYVLVLSGFEIAESLGYFENWFRQLGAWTMALYCLAGATVFLQARPALFGAAATPSPLPPSDGLEPLDRQTLQRLDAAMSEGEAWRKEGLTIGQLAEQVAAPEHRLRRLINDHLGFRNFAAFVNARRIEAAKRRLVDPAHARETVAAIAFELGFGSLGPFNRAFKEATGLTPTEFRRAQGLPIPENSS